jgi:SAM-dependent methyltransferase
VRVADHGRVWVLDVGCGPGALTALLVERLGIDAVSAIDPSASFVAALGERIPGIDVRSGSAEQLPFPDDHFDEALAELVVHFMTDPVAGLTEMGPGRAAGDEPPAGRLIRRGGSPHHALAGGADIDPDVRTGGPRRAREGHLASVQGGRADGHRTRC